ncbi:MAG: DNA polymerase III subunit delta [Myxococcota bacterium]|nr:DNA polymerase III subunit delta [Myxococcota bacterium]MEC8425650.1 DNA polymerase III subunit delta [Myxococcota bacterium]
MNPPANDVPVHLIVGDAGLLVSETEAALVSAALDGRAAGFNLATFDAAEGAPGALSLARTPPMMAARRVIVIRGMQRAPVALLDALLAYVDNPSPTTMLVLSGEKTPAAVGGRDRGKVLANRIAKQGGLQRLRARDQRPVPFAQARARAAGCELDASAARMLVELVGADLGQIRLELDKAIAYAGGSGRIDMSTIEATSSVVAEAVQWDLTDAIVARDADKGLAVTYRMLEDARTSGGAHRLLGLVNWQVRELLLLQDALRRGERPSGKWARVPSAKLQAARRNLERYPLDPAVTLGALREANRQLNRARAGGQRVFESLVMQLTAR